LTSIAERATLLCKYDKGGWSIGTGSSLSGFPAAMFKQCFLEEDMKKKVKKLELNRETVRNLTSDDLKKIAGGSDVTVPRTCCNSCRISCA
jgi:hypothetical protein